MDIYIACEDLDFVWDTKGVREVTNAWNKGFSTEDIAKTLKRDADEVAILIMDLKRKGWVVRRQLDLRSSRIGL